MSNLQHKRSVTQRLVELASRLLQASLKETVVIIHARTDNSTMGNAAASACQTIISRETETCPFRHQREKNPLSSSNSTQRIRYDKKLRRFLYVPSALLKSLRYRKIAAIIFFCTLLKFHHFQSIFDI